MTQTTKPAPVTAKKSHSDGTITIAAQLRCGGWNSDRARIDASTELTLEQARALAASILILCDAADGRAAAKAAAEQRHSKWRDREVAAGRMRPAGCGL